MTAYIFRRKRTYVLHCATHAINGMRPRYAAIVSALERGIADLAEGKAPFKDMSALHQALRMARCEHHHVFCLLREDAPALIVAILHERMDLMKRLADRLNE